VSESTDLVAVLLSAEVAERESLVRAAEPGRLASVIERLGQQREPAAAEVLALIDSVVDDRGLRKAARRELHRLRSTGVQAPQLVGPPAEPAPARVGEHVDVSQAWATDIDPSGSRALWLLGERRLGGVWFSALLLNDARGLQEMSLVDTTRKRFLRDFEESRRTAGTWIELPGDYALRLIREGVDLAREQGVGVPTRYRALRDVFGEADAGPERALAYDTISPVEVNFNPDWLDDSPRLLSEPEVAGWHVPVPADLRPRALEVARGPAAGLLVPGHTPEQNALQLLADAAQQALTPVVRHALRRRLEETAYIFVATERLPAARRAVAAALAVQDERLPPDRHPLLRLLLASGLARLIATESLGGRRASEVLIDLIERATTNGANQRDSQSSSIETRPSGLIVPR
jgi:hypothetical protein